MATAFAWRGTVTRFAWSLKAASHGLADPGLRNAVAQLKPANSFLIDGEVVVGTQASHADFNALRYGFPRTKPVALVAFDLLSLDGQDLRPLPLIERQALPEKLVKGRGVGGGIFDLDAVG